MSKMKSVTRVQILDEVLSVSLMVKRLVGWFALKHINIC